MNDLTQWVADHAALAGILGCGVSQPGGVCLCRSAEPTICPPEKVEQILRQLAGPATPPDAADLSTLCHTWVFAEGKIRFVRRPDGWTLVAVARTDAAAAKTLEALATDFLALAPGN